MSIISKKEIIYDVLIRKKYIRLTPLALIAIAGYIYMSELKSQQNSVNTGTGLRLQ